MKARISLLAATLATLALPNISPLWAMPTDPNTCFDLRKPVTQPLHELDPDMASAHGKRAEGGGWATARAYLKLPINETIALLRDQTTLKNPKEADLKIKREKRDGLLDFQTVDITIHPVPFVTVNWEEQWSYNIIEGTAENPKKVLISYQKTDGTSHIRHFCGNILVMAAGPQATDVMFYEEADATKRTPEAIAKGHEGTLRTIREKADQRAEKIGAGEPGKQPQG